MLSERTDDQERAALGSRFLDATGSDGRHLDRGRSTSRQASRDELYEQAKEKQLSGRSSMTKDELAKALDERA